MSAFRKTAAIAVVLSGLLLGDAAPALAYRYRWCEKRIHDAKVELTRAIRKYGVDSPEAESRRHVLAELRDRCSNSGRGDNAERRERREYEEHAEHERRD